MSDQRSKAVAVAIAAALTATTLTATAVAAARRPAAGITTKATDTQLILWRTAKDGPSSTTSKTWSELRLPSDGSIALPSEFMLWARGPISLTFNGMFSRAPVELRVRDGARVMPPGAVNFTPQPGDNAFSFTFVSPRKGKRACTGPLVEWRSPTGQEVRLNKVTIVVHYKAYQPDESVRCV